MQQQWPRYFLIKNKSNLALPHQTCVHSYWRGIRRMIPVFSFANNRCLNLTEVAAQDAGCLSSVTGNNKNQRPTLNSDNVYSRVAKCCWKRWVGLFTSCLWIFPSNIPSLWHHLLCKGRRKAWNHHADLWLELRWHSLVLIKKILLLLLWNWAALTQVYLWQMLKYAKPKSALNLVQMAKQKASTFENSPSFLLFTPPADC